MAEELDPTGGLITVGNIRLRTPGLAGVAEVYRPGSVTGGAGATRDIRDGEQTMDAFEAALRNENVEPQATVEIAAPREVPAMAAVPTRSTASDEPAIEAQVPSPNEDYGQVVLSIDESGARTWTLAREESGAVDTTTRGGELRTYLVPRAVAPTPEGEAATRSVVGAAGKKLLKVLVFPLIDPIIGKIGEDFASKWEAKKRPYGLRTFTPDDYNQEAGTPITPERLQQMSGGRALLFVHGTFSRACSAFGALSKPTVEKLHEIYQGRVFAFDHYTMSEDPIQNARWFVDHLPANLHLNFDIVCHSRGGLVSRTLAEKQSDLPLGGRTLDVGKIVFVAAPNAGTTLADSKYMGDFVDSYTNLLSFLPSNGATEIFEGLITVVKMLAVGVLRGLPGLQSMVPNGGFLTQLNTSPVGADKYFALASDYTPTDPGLKAWAANRLLDRIFQKAANDLVVPMLGVYDKNGCGYFPIADKLVYGQGDGISHTTYFGEPRTQERILGWLGEG
jgi:pimeloyl-ACP methyl ester carboxylesterase